ncbi:MAG: phosphoribosyltransferase [Cyclobacteriaceae bacterium]
MKRDNREIDPLTFKELLELSMDVKWLIRYNIQLATIWNLFKGDEERELIKTLLGRFTYLDSGDIMQITQKIRQTVIESWKLESTNTFFVATSDNPEADGSQAFIQSLKNNFASWKERNFNNSVSNIEDFDNNSNIVLVDDFIGSGKTAIRRLKWVNDKLYELEKNKSRVYFIAIAGMEEGINNINKEFYEELFVAHKLHKGISDYFSDSEKGKMLELMLTMEERLGAKYKRKKLRDFSLGYGKSEALYTVEALSTPNNVFPVFWWPVLADGTDWDTFFKRL